MTDSRIAVLGRAVVPVTEPVLRGDDLGVLHGDGLFETLHLRAGRPWLLTEHLDRLTRAADALDLPLPPRAALVELLDTISDGWPPDVEGALRLVCTRGPEGGGGTTVYATLAEVPATARRARRTGIDVVTLPLGVTATGRPELGWLPTGVKSTSYAASSAARRFVARTGADDALWVSTDGYVLEGPTANVVWMTGGTLCTVPADATGILPGVTARWLLDQAPALGLTADERMVTPEQLRAADAAWLTSSLRGAAPIRTLDTHPLPYRAFPLPGLHPPG
ncbi:aminotransferase class IV [Micromonospora sp. NPDC000207]|uniref:aminotransferase class IV n=1 Tax=Micromonospora sp. NPDC000207 TaxID=3154246 RepID=UPI00331C5646